MIKEVKSVDISYINSLLHAKKDDKDKKDDCEWNPDKHDGDPCPHHESGDANFKYEQPKQPTKTKEQLEKEALDKMNEETRKINAVNANIRAKQEQARLTKPEPVDAGKDITKTGEELGKLGKQVGEAPFGKSGRKEYETYEYLNDEELRRKINRLKNEREYSDLRGDTRYIKSGKDKARELLQTLGAILGIVGTGVTIIATVKNLRGGRSTAQSENLNTVDSLCHYGVKGMKWGTRKVNEETTKSSSSKPTEKEEDDKQSDEEAAKAKKKKIAIAATLALGATALIAIGIKKSRTINSQKAQLDSAHSTIEKEQVSKNWYKTRYTNMKMKSENAKKASSLGGAFLNQINISVGKGK